MFSTYISSIEFVRDPLCLLNTLQWNSTCSVVSWSSQPLYVGFSMILLLVGCAFRFVCYNLRLLSFVWLNLSLLSFVWLNLSLLSFLSQLLFCSVCYFIIYICPTTDFTLDKAVCICCASSFSFLHSNHSCLTTKWRLLVWSIKVLKQ